MDPTTALISNAPSVVAALSDLDRIGMISFLIVLVVGLWFNQRNTAKALNSLEDVIRALIKDMEIRNKGLDNDIKEILAINKSMDKELLEIKHICSTKYSTPWNSDISHMRYNYNTPKKKDDDGDYIH